MYIAVLVHISCRLGTALAYLHQPLGARNSEGDAFSPECGPIIEFT